MSVLKLADLAVRKEFALGPLWVSPPLRLVRGPMGEVHVEPLIMQVLLVLADARGEVVTRNQLYDECWGGVNVGDYSLNRAITMVRRIAAKACPDAFRVESIPRTGYRLVTEPLPTGARAWRAIRERPRPVIAVALVAAVAALGSAYFGFAGARHVPTIMVMADGRDPFSKSIADTIASAALDPQLMDKRVRVIDAAMAATDANADFVLKVATVGGDAHRTRLTLASVRDQSVLWTWTAAEQRSGEVSPSYETRAVSAAVLDCAAETLWSGSGEPDPATLRLYLDACAKFEPMSGAELSLLANSFERVIAKAPQWRGAWAKLFLCKAEMIEVGFPSPQLVEGLRRNLAASRRLGIEIPETYIAEAAVMPLNARYERLERYEAGLARYPQSLYLLVANSWQLRAVGRMRDAALSARRAVQLYAESPAANTEYVQSLMSSGQVEAARAVLGRAERAAPGAVNLKYVRFRFELRYGDPRAVLAMVRRGDVVASPSLASFLNARLDGSPANIDRAIADQLAAYRVDRRDPGPAVQALGLFGRKDEAISLLLGYPYPHVSGPLTEDFFRPSLEEVRHDVRFMRVAQMYDLNDYWLRSGKWPDFCVDPKLPYDCKQEAAKLRKSGSG